MAAAARERPVVATTPRSRRWSTTARSAARRSASSRSRRKEGVWFAYDAKTGSADLSAHQGDRPDRAPDAAAGPARRHLPVVARRPQLLARVVRPGDGLRLQRGVGDASALVQTELTPDAAAAASSPRATSSSASRTATSARTSPGWQGSRLDQRDRRATGKRVWKFDTPEPERGGVTTTASGVGFAGGGDGVLRAFDTKTGKVLWTFQTGKPDRRGRVGLRGGRQGVRRDHGRRHADVVERRHRLAGARRFDARRQQKGAGSRSRAPRRRLGASAPAGGACGPAVPAARRAAFSLARAEGAWPWRDDGVELRQVRAR